MLCYGVMIQEKQNISGVNFKGHGVGQQLYMQGIGMKSKYKSTRGCRDLENNICASRLEADVSDMLIFLQRSGRIKDIRRQKTLVLCKTCGLKWRIDFEVTTNEPEYCDGGRTVYVEAKGMETRAYRQQLKAFLTSEDYKDKPLFIIKRKGKHDLHFSAKYNVEGITLFGD